MLSRLSLFKSAGAVAAKSFNNEIYINARLQASAIIKAFNQASKDGDTTKKKSQPKSPKPKIDIFSMLKVKTESSSTPKKSVEGASKQESVESIQTKNTNSRVSPREFTADHINEIDKILKDFSFSIESAKKVLENIYELVQKDSKLVMILSKNQSFQYLIKYLTDNLNSLSTNEFSILFELSVETMSKNIQVLKKYAEMLIDSLNGNQLVKLITLLSSKKLGTVREEIHPYTIKLKQKIADLDNFYSLVKALYLFQTDKFFTEQLNDKILEMSDQLGTKEWLSLINTKSILRHRDNSILEACTYNLNKSEEVFRLEDIKTCFLSFGILMFYDSLLAKRLLKDLLVFIEDSKNVALNEARFSTLNTVILSLGMLRLRDTNLLVKLSEYLYKQLSTIKDKEQYDNYDVINIHQLIINFVISCAHLNIVPETEAFNRLVNQISLKYFNPEKIKSKSQLISLTWSLCALDKVKPEFVKYLFNEEFYKSFFDYTSHKDFIPSFMKLLQINLYSITSMPNYQGPNLPPDVNILEYQNILQFKPSSANSVMLATLSSFATKDKYFKSNLLMPYGVMIDAFMIIDKKGEPQLLEKYYNAETSEYDVDPKKYYKVAFKFLNNRDMTNITEKFDGLSKMNLKLLDSLDYLAIPVKYSEFNSSDNTIVSRVELIQKKLSQFAQKPSLAKAFLK